MPSSPPQCKAPSQAMLPLPSLLCGVCNEVCKRASKISCCGAQCCWGCGVRSITKARKCWNCPNICAVTGDLVKHTQLRDAISQLRLTNSKELNTLQLSKSSQIKLTENEVDSLEHKDNKHKQHDDISIQENCDYSKKYFEKVVLKNEEAEKISIPPFETKALKVDLKENERIADKPYTNLSELSERTDEPENNENTEKPERKVEPESTEHPESFKWPERTEEPERTDEPVRIKEPIRVKEPARLSSKLSDVNLNVPDAVKNIIEKVTNSTYLVKNNIETDFQIGEVSHAHINDTKALDVANLVPALGNNEFRTEEIKLVCDNNIPKISERVIHSEEKSCSKNNSTVKIDLKSNFKKLSQKVKLFDVPKLESSTDLEMFEKNLLTNANGDHIGKETASAEEVRIVKMVDELDKNDKIVRIIEELDKTKSLSKRRKSGESQGSVSKSSPTKPLEAVPITNALQGLQALLKMSKMSDSTSTKPTTDSTCPENKSGRSRNVSGSSSRSSKSRHGDKREVSSRRRSDSHEQTNVHDYKSRNSDSRDSRSRHGDHKDSKSRYSESPSLTKINRSALVRDSQVETHSKSLVEEQNNKKSVVEDLQAVTNSKSGYHYEAGRSRSKFQSFQMKDIRKRLLPTSSSSSNTISSRAAEVARRMKEEGEEVKVLSYRMVKPKIDDSQDHERVIRNVDEENKEQNTMKLKTDVKRKVVSSDGLKEKIVRKVFEVEKGKGLNNLEQAVKETVKNGTKCSGTLNIFQKSIVKIQSQENTDEPKVAPERRKSLDLIKEELERVTCKVNDIKKNSISREISSDDDMKVIMDDDQQMEKEAEDSSVEEENERKSKSKKKKHKDDKKKRKSKHTGDIAIDARIAKKIISRIISSDMGKTFNEVIKQEVGETESTIEKLREDLRKKSSHEEKSKKKKKKDKNKEGKEKKKKKKDKYGDEENPNEVREKKKRSRERSEINEEKEPADQAYGVSEEKGDENALSSKIEDKKSPKSRKSKKRKSTSPVRFYDQVPDEKATESSVRELEDSEGRQAKKIKSEEEKERKDNHKKKKSKKKHKRDRVKKDFNKQLGNNLDLNQESASVESKTEVLEERIVRKRSTSPSKDFDLVLGVAEDDILDYETDIKEVKKTVEIVDSMTETEVDTTIDETDTNNDTDLSTSVIDAALEDVPVRESATTVDFKDQEDTSTSNTSNTSNSGANSSANSEDEHSEDEDNLRALLLSQLSKTRCGPKVKTKKRSSTHIKAQSSKITKISWSSPPPEPVEVTSTTPSIPPTSSVPPTSTPSYPPLGSLPVYAYAYSRTFITPAEKLLSFPNLYHRIVVPLDLESDSDSDCQSDCDVFWGEKRTSQWINNRMNQGYSETDPRFSQANLNLVMRQARDSSSPAPL